MRNFILASLTIFCLACVSSISYAGDLPEGWTDTNIGTGFPAGSSDYTNGTWTVEGSGDIADTSDTLKFIYTPLYGDGEISVKVESISADSSKYFSGVMIRETLAPDSIHAAALLRPSDSNFQFRRRRVTGGGSLYTSDTTFTAPYFVKLVRIGNTFTSYHSQDGTAWTQFASATIEMNTAVYAGLAVDANSNTVVNTTVFSNLNLVSNVAPPALSHSTGVYSSSVTVAVSSVQQNAEIRYTTDGSEPNESSTLYSSELTFTSNTQLKMKAFLNGASSETVSEYYVIDNYTKGLIAEYYDIPALTYLPDFSAYTPDYVTTVDKLLFMINSGGVFANSGLFHATAVFSGKIIIPSADTYTFFLKSADGSKLYIDNTPVIDNDGVHSVTELSGSLTLSPGLHDIRVEFFNSGQNGSCLELYWETPTVSKQAVLPAFFATDDIDNDSLPDSWEISYHGDLSHIGTEDSDGDTWNDATELSYNSNPGDPEIHPLPPMENLTLSQGLVASFYQGDWKYITPDFSIYPPSYVSVFTGDIAADSISDFSIPFTNYGVVLKGYINAPEDGAYYIAVVEAHKSITLFVDGQPLFYDIAALQRYTSIFLKKGIHSLEVKSIFYNWQSIDRTRLYVKWLTPAAASWQLVPSSVLFYAPDYLDQMNAIADRDQDGLTNDYENSHNLNPEDADTDGDGLSDGEEVELGTNPLLADTDGDGVNDYTEVKIAFSNPLVADFDGSQTTLGTIHGSEITATSTGWIKDGDSIYSVARNGWIEYSVNIPSDNTYVIELSAEQHNALFEGESSFVIDIYVDGSYSGTHTLKAPEGAEGNVLFFLPELSPGNHTVRLVWNNMESDTFLQINSLELLSFGGTDTDSNGVADWLDNRLAHLGGITIPQQSKVSPVCAEGENAANIDQMAIIGFYTAPGETPEEPVFRHGIKNTWYSNIPLDPENPTQLTFSFQNGAKTVDRTVTWTETNIIEETANTTIRLNDSLLLNAYPAGATDGTAAITVEGNTLSVSPGSPVEYKFENSGDVTVSATYTPADGGTPVTESITVKVVAASFSSTPICMVNDPRTWDNPNIPDEAVIENDSSVSFNITDIPTGGKSFYMVALNSTPAYIVARLGENGPLLASTKVEAIKQIITPEKNLTLIETFQDGSKMVEGYILLSDLPEGFRLHIYILTGGILFMNGTHDLWITADDFDENGIFRYRMIVPADKTGAICHSFTFYQDDILIGDE